MKIFRIEDNKAHDGNDRRAAYYAAVADEIARDPLAFYARAELGRRVQQNWATPAPEAKPRSIKDIITKAGVRP